MSPTDTAKLEMVGIGLVALAALAFVAWVLMKPRAASRAIVDTAGNIAAGTVVGIGDQVGLPDPATHESQDRCAQALAAGDHWNASLYCPAGTFLKSLFTPKGAPNYSANVITPGGDAAAGP